jgi:hypothetical protein
MSLIDPFGRKISAFMAGWMWKWKKGVLGMPVFREYRDYTWRV